ncbi:MAG: hypothetical protein E6Q88_13645 [Lysobacteraceae bacterium]|nr:MAG: hypothetical protein E6Q88_13645 [Xanthomonadaceae bacterium]
MLFVLVSLVVAAAPAPASGTDVPGLVSYPPLNPVQWAMNKTNLSKLKVTVEVQWGADGAVSQARILERTPSGALEKSRAQMGARPAVRAGISRRRTDSVRFAQREDRWRQSADAAASGDSSLTHSSWWAI